MRQSPLVFERVYHAPVSKVWRALTDVAQMKQWYFDVDGFKPEIGFQFSFAGQGHNGEQYIHRCIVTEVIPEKKLAYSWRYDGHEGDSLVVFELSAEGSNTRLKLTHAGLESFPANNPDFRRESFEGGWAEITGTMLKEFVETDSLRLASSIEAPTNRVWEVLTEEGNVRKWGAAFQDAWVSADWQLGSPVVWYDKNGNEGAKGFVKEVQPRHLLSVAFPEEGQNAGDSDVYHETFRLEAEGEGATKLSLVAGPLQLKYLKNHAPMWEDALSRIKALAEG